MAFIADTGHTFNVYVFAFYESNTTTFVSIDSNTMHSIQIKLTINGMITLAFKSIQDRITVSIASPDKFVNKKNVFMIFYFSKKKREEDIEFILILHIFVHLSCSNSESNMFGIR